MTKVTPCKDGPRSMTYRSDDRDYRATDCPVCQKMHDPFGTGDNWYVEFDCQYPNTCYFDGWPDPTDIDSKEEA